MANRRPPTYFHSQWTIDALLSELVLTIEYFHHFKRPFSHVTPTRHEILNVAYAFKLHLNAK